MTEPLHPVELLRLPIAVHARSQEHSAELIREMYLIAQQLHDEPAATERALPARLLALVDELGQQFAGFTTANDLLLTEAIDSGATEIDLVYELPFAAAEAAQHLSNIFDEADEFCRAGRHLLTLATPPDLVAYRRWFLTQIIDQLGGRPAVSWPEFVAA
jgi:hypothetical protein